MISCLCSCRCSLYFQLAIATHTSLSTLPGAFANVWKLDCALHLALAIHVGCLCDCSPNRSCKGSRQTIQAVLGPACRRLKGPQSQQVRYWTGYTAPMLLPCLNKQYQVGLSLSHMLCIKFTSNDLYSTLCIIFLGFFLCMTSQACQSHHLLPSASGPYQGIKP